MIPYFSFRMMNAVISVDYLFIKRFTNYIEALTKSSDEEDIKAVEFLEKIQITNLEPKDSKKFYFKFFELSKIFI
jgi:hypothetical protein